MQQKKQDSVRLFPNQLRRDRAAVQRAYDLLELVEGSQHADEHVERAAPGMARGGGMPALMPVPMPKK